jgi:hypothetical protein
MAFQCAFEQASGSAAATAQSDTSCPVAYDDLAWDPIQTIHAKTGCKNLRVPITYFVKNWLNARPCSSSAAPLFGGVKTFVYR